MSIIRTLKRWAAVQQTTRELSALTNEQLRSLGITRKDIRKIAHDHARLVK